MSYLKENSSHIMNGESLSLPPTRVGRKRRSSILKPQRPFSDVQNLSRDDSRTSKDRRVSFCPTIEVKEFNKHNPTDPSSEGRGRDGEGSNGDIKQVALPSPEEPHKIQMSTPVKKKKRRISADAIARLSIIPKADRSFSFFPDNDFEIYEDEETQRHVMPPATAPPDEITLLEELPDPQIGCVDLHVDTMVDLELNETGPVPVSSPHSTHSHTAPPSSHPPLPTELPSHAAVMEDDTERLIELFPQAALPTIISTPTEGHTQYLAMPTPDITTPQEGERRRKRVGSMACRRLVGGGGAGGRVGVGEDEEETKNDSIHTDLVPPSLPEPKPSESCDDHVTLSRPPATPHLEPVIEEEGSQMDMTCQSETLQTSTTLATPSVTAGTTLSVTAGTTPPVTAGTTPPVTAGTTPSVTPDNLSLPVASTSVTVGTSSPPLSNVTPILDQPKDLALHVLPDAATTSLPDASPVFKQPKMSLRSQLKLKSSGRKVVKASPIVRTPRPLTRSLSSVPTPLTPLPILSTTFTKIPLKSPPPATGDPASESGATVSTPPPSSSTPHTSPNTPHTSPPPPPTDTMTKETVPVHSLLATPPCSVASPAPPPAEPDWLQSSCDSFNLITSENEVSEEASQTSSLGCPPEIVDEETMAESESQSVEMTVPSTHSPVATGPPSIHQLTVTHIPAALVATPSVPHTPVPSSQTTRLATALQHLQVSAPKLTAPPVSIETPEVALIEVPPALPAVEDATLHISSLQTAFNESTLCERSVLLSASIYDKFVAQICRDDQPPPKSPPPTSLQSEIDTRHSPPPLSTTSHSSPSACPSVSTATKSPTPFGHFLSDLTSRLTDMLSGVYQRLQSDSYTASYYCFPLVLDKWSRVLAACLGTLTVLQQYGNVSGLSLTHSWNSEDVPSELPQAPLGQEDMDGELAMKIEWITELIASYNLLLPSAIVARDQAALLYGWYFEEWSHDTNTQHVTVAVQSEHHQFELSVSDITTDRFTATKSMVESIRDLMSVAELPPSTQD